MIESVVDVTTQLQRQVALEFGFEDADIGVRLMLTAEEVYPDHAQGRTGTYFRALHACTCQRDEMIRG